MLHKMSVIVEKSSHSRFFPQANLKMGLVSEGLSGLPTVFNYSLHADEKRLAYESILHRSPGFNNPTCEESMMKSLGFSNVAGDATLMDSLGWDKNEDLVLKSVFVETVRNVMEIGSNFAGTTMKSTRLSPSEKDSPPMLPCDMLLQVDTPAHPITYYDESSYL